ncbi:unnamed protein product [Brugia timori]|uniref:Uncharacterized protein n=1 Tax=Brugia timori TaxID=42155 RepID=A0A0R3R6L3_9BILA|nr:unnamed protein product [Brugia timori]
MNKVGIMNVYGAVYVIAHYMMHQHAIIKMECYSIVMSISRKKFACYQHIICRYNYQKKRERNVFE